LSKNGDDGNEQRGRFATFERIGPSTAPIQVHSFAWGGMGVCDGAHCAFVTKEWLG
jgi:hypothetical protein